MHDNGGKNDRKMDEVVREVLDRWAALLLQTDSFCCSAGAALQRAVGDCVPGASRESKAYLRIAAASRLGRVVGKERPGWAPVAIVDGWWDRRNRTADEIKKVFNAAIDRS